MSRKAASPGNLPAVTGGSDLVAWSDEKSLL
jgi:hypothetical protein